MGVQAQLTGEDEGPRIGSSKLQAPVRAKERAKETRRGVLGQKLLGSSG